MTSAAAAEVPVRSYKGVIDMPFNEDLYLIDESQTMSVALVSAPPLTDGTYLFDLTNLSGVTETGRAVGTLRVDWSSKMLSGDLYQFLPGVELPFPGADVPAFEDSAYLGYLRGLRVEDQDGGSGSLRIHLGLQRLDRVSMQWTPLEERLILVVDQVPAPAGWPGGSDVRTGRFKDGGGGSIGSVHLGKISPFFRKAAVEIALAPNVPAPLNNGAEVDWPRVFEKVDWKVEPKTLNDNFGSPEAPSMWTLDELHKQMLDLQSRSASPRDWTYFLACVPFIHDVDRGIMFDSGAVDTNQMPRQGAAIASGWPLEEGDAWDGIRAGGAQTLGDVALLYFRTAVHEIGHVMGLGHSNGNNFLMNTTPDLFKRSSNFPNNIQFEFRPLDQIRLRHWPDPYVRPGGVALPEAEQTDGSVIADKDLNLEVGPLTPCVPLGAPVRVWFSVANKAEESVSLPSLSLKDGHVGGYVSGPDGVREFRPIILRMDEDKLFTLGPDDEPRLHWITLLRGPQGALFPVPGKYEVQVRLRRNLDDGSTAVVSGSCKVEVASEEAFVSAAQKVLVTPDTLLVLALGGDHLKDGLAALKTALANKVLKPHFAVVEAKRRARLAQRLDGVWRYLSKETVMSGAELLRIAEAVVWRRGVRARLKKVLEPHVAKLEDLHPGIGRELDEVLATGRVPRRIATTVPKK